MRCIRETEKVMKSVMIGSLAAIVIGIAAGAILNTMNQDAGQAFSTENARVK